MEYFRDRFDSGKYMDAENSNQWGSMYTKNVQVYKYFFTKIFVKRSHLGLKLEENLITFFKFSKENNLRNKDQRTVFFLLEFVSIFLLVNL